mmetsp:Transcript_24669/g.50928  ORF Transcript_24669/g.50928 Transcript_24669/m.50928 type:complete len:235 (-) Transcript_24669:171-875(-)
MWASVGSTGGAPWPLSSPWPWPWPSPSPSPAPLACQASSSTTTSHPSRSATDVESCPGGASLLFSSSMPATVPAIVPADATDATLAATSFVLSSILAEFSAPLASSAATAATSAAAAAAACSALSPDTSSLESKDRRGFFWGGTALPFATSGSGLGLFRGGGAAMLPLGEAPPGLDAAASPRSREGRAAASALTATAPNEGVRPVEGSSAGGALSGDGTSITSCAMLKGGLRRT